MPTFVFRTAFALGLGLVLASPVLAQAEPRTAHVRVADLDLAQPAGQQALQHRVSHALTRVCGDPAARDLMVASAIRACRADAMADLAPRMAQAIASAHTGRTYALAALPATRDAS